VRWLLGVGLAVAALPTRAHDVGADVSFTSVIRQADATPRAGGVAVGLSGSIDVSEAVSVWLAGQLLHQLATTSSASGMSATSSSSNVMLFSLGSLWLPHEHWSFLFSLQGSPPARQTTATTVQVERLPGGSAAVVMQSDSLSLGGSAIGSWLSGGLSRWEHLLDALVSVNYFGVFQQIDLTRTTLGETIDNLCQMFPRQRGCGLVRGRNSPLWQVRLGGAYTASLWANLDVGLEAAGYLYSDDPLSVGTYSVLLAGRQGLDLGAGVPVAPLAFTLRPSVAYRWPRVTLKVGYQAGWYVQGVGFNHLATFRASVKVTSVFWLSATVLGQLDVQSAEVAGSAVTALLGATVRW
jgi:hypothetical protein